MNNYIMIEDVSGDFLYKKGKIFLVSDRRFFNVGKVVEVYEGCDTIKVGDYIAYDSSVCNSIKIKDDDNNKEYYLLFEDEILAIIEDEDLK